MAISNYPSGFTHGVTVRGVPVTVAHPGQVFFVNNSLVLAPKGVGGSDGNSGTYQKPFSTINGAIVQCTAGQGNIIFVMPGHAETVSTAAGVNLSKAGVAVIGLGNGSLRPTFNLTATGSTVSISAANCSLKNVLITGGVDAIASAVVVSAADCTIEGCELRDVTGQMTDGILTTAGAERLKILNHVHNGDVAAGTNAAIAIVGGSDIEITAEALDGNFAVGAIDVRTTLTTNLFVHDMKRVFTRNSADIILIDTITGSTGQIGPNINGRLTDNAANITQAFTGATFVYMQPLNLVNLAGESSLQSTITASTNA